MGDDITTALETVREWLTSDTDLWDNAAALAALSTIEAELTRLREVHVHAERLLENPDYRNVLLGDENERLRAERDEARDYGERLYTHVQRLEAWRQHLEAALRYIAEAHGPQPEAHWRNAARDALARPSIPREPTDA